MSNETKKVGRREKYPFATWEVGDTFTICGWSNESYDMAHKLRCAANNRKGDKSWRFETKVDKGELDEISIVTIKRVK